MLESLKKYYPVNIDLQDRIKTAFALAVGVFLFILFFQPFYIKQPDINSYILLIAGFAGIVFLLQFIIHSALPWGRSRKTRLYLFRVLLTYELIQWILISVAFSFYLRFVGHVKLSIFLVFRISILSLLPAVVNLLSYEKYKLKMELLQGNRPSSGKQSIELRSESGSDKIKLDLKNLILFRAAENYVEIFFRKEGKTEKKLLRTTLKNIEEAVRDYKYLIRCHRNSIVNIDFVTELKRNSHGFKLMISGCEEEVAVSRQYLLFVKDALAMGK